MVGLARHPDTYIIHREHISSCSEGTAEREVEFRPTERTGSSSKQIAYLRCGDDYVVGESSRVCVVALIHTLILGQL